MKIARVIFLIVPVIFLLANGCKSDPQSIREDSESIIFLTGSYSDEKDEGVKLFSVDRKSGEIEYLSGSIAGTNPSFLSLSLNNNLIYAVNEVSGARDFSGGSITTLLCNFDTRELHMIDNFKTSGSGPCHISTHPSGELLFSSNYRDGSLSVTGVDSLGLPEIELAYYKYLRMGRKAPRVHMTLSFMDGKRVLLSDLGQDRLIEYKIDIEGGNVFFDQTRTVDLNDESGPRHFIFDKKEQYLFVLQEISSEITVLRRHITGDYSEVQTISTLPADFSDENFCAHIDISPDGKYIYASNRGHNSIAVFSLSTSGELDLIETVSCQGDWPRNFDIDSKGEFLVVANQRSNNIALFSIDSDTGIPTFSGQTFDIDSPSCIIFAPDNF